MMVHTCFLCKWRSDREPRRSFHQFPPDTKGRNQWLEIIGKSNETIGKCTSLCSIHFDESCFRYGLVFNKRILKKGSLPSLNLTQQEGQNYNITSNTQKTANSQSSEENIPRNRAIKRTVEQTDVEIPMQKPCLQSINSPIPVIISTISITELNLLKDQIKEKNRQLKIQNYHLTKQKYELAEKKKKIAALNRQVSRLSKKKLKLQEIIKNSNRKIKKLGKEKKEEVTLGPVLKSLLSQANLKKKKVHEYPHELKLFATTVSFLSPPAYTYIKAVLPLLPTASTIRKWLNEIKIEPGICNTSFDILKAKVTETNKFNKKLLCNIVMDNITIRKHLRLNGKQYSGAESKLFPSSKETMVIMVVCINEDWKIPVAHYYIDELSAKDKAELLLECLTDLHSTGIIVTSILIDSGTSNMMMAKNLGLDVRSTESFEKHFPHPVTKEPVYVMIDIYHAIRLVRNALADKGILFDANGDAIKWKYFKLLLKYQYRYNLQTSTKIRKSHINFMQDKTNVKLATQILSNGVSEGLQCLRTVIQLPEFAESCATEAFCTVMNDIFKLLNFRRSLKNTGVKGLINRDNIEIIRSKIVEYEYYIKSLRESKNLSILDTNRKLGFIGILISLHSVLAVFDKYSALDENTFKHLPTYKLSQDHFDLYLNFRSRGVRHNNPTEEQFQTAFKKHLVFAQVDAPDFFNCITPENTCLSKSNKKSKNPKVSLDNNVCIAENRLETLEHSDGNVEWEEFEITKGDQNHVNIISSNTIQDSSGIGTLNSEENILILTLD